MVTRLLESPAKRPAYGYWIGLAGSCSATVAARPAVAADAPTTHHRVLMLNPPVVAADACEPAWAGTAEAVRFAVDVIAGVASVVIDVVTTEPVAFTAWTMKVPAGSPLRL